MLARIALTGWLAIAVGWPALSDAREPRFSTWQYMPVFHNGRMMPVDAFAQQMVDAVCDTANPRLSLDGVSAEARSLPEFRETEKLFPDGPRKFSAAELLYSWIVEPERWELVPLLIAEHEDLRKDVLGLPTVSDSGKRLKYASPREVTESEGFWRALDEIQRKRRQSAGEKLSLTGIEQKVGQLSQALATYRSLTFDPYRNAPQHFMVKLGDAATAWNGAATAWAETGSGLERLTPAIYESSVDQQIEAIRSALSSLSEITDRGGTDPARAELMLASVSGPAAELAEITERGMQEIFRRSPPEGYREAEWTRLRSQAHLMATRAADLATAVGQAQLALYDSRPSLRLVPGLNPPALEKDRDTGEDAQPWLSLQTLLLSGDGVYRRFLRPDLPPTPSRPIYPEGRNRVEYLRALAAEGNPLRTERAAFAEAAVAYTDRGAADRAERFETAMDRFSAEVRRLGEGIESHRAEMPLRGRDETLIAATAYPPPGSTAAEVHYSRLDPFLWSWLFSFLALCCLAVALGALRAPMFWLGTLLLLVGQTFSIYGFALRVYVTGWAPVTNMFETVVFVALVSAVLGLWFALVPLFGPGLRSAWRMTAIPGTPEASEHEDGDLALMGAGGWAAIRWVLAIPRLALAIGVYYALTAAWYGSGTTYAIVRLAPRSDTLNDRVVWFVGLILLALAVWLTPRIVLSTILSAVTLPWTLARQGLAPALRRAVDRKAFAAVGAGCAFVVGLVAYYAPIWDKGINPLMPVLRDNFWLTVHVLSITASYGAGFLAWGLGIAAMGHYLFGRYRDTVEPSAEHAVQGHRPVAGYVAPADALRRRGPEACAALSGFIYRAIQVAVVLLAAGTILGGLWADVSWGRFWGWDAKEVWALITLLIYLVVLHFRYTGVLRDFALAAGAVFAITAVVMAWWGVNYFFGTGMHSYGSGEGGGWYVAAFFIFNLIAVAAAAARYLAETGASVLSVESAETVDVKAVPKPQ